MIGLRGVGLVLAGAGATLVAGSAPTTVLVPGPPAAAAAAAPPTSCRAAALPVPTGMSDVKVTGTSPDGRLMVGEGSTPGGERSVVWRDGRVVAAPDVPLAFILADVNNRGVAVGLRSPAIARPRPYVYQSGRVIALPGGSDGMAAAINEHGVIAGTRWTGLANEPLRWASPTSRPIALALPAGYRLASGYDIVGIGEDGTVVATLLGKHYIAYMWRPNGRGAFLPRPPTILGHTFNDYRSKGFRNGRIAVSGRSISSHTGSSTLTWVFRYNVATNRYEKLSDNLARWIEPTAINAEGSMVGQHAKAPFQSVLITGHGIAELPTPDHADTATAGTVSNGGHIIGGFAGASREGFWPIDWHC